MDSQPLLIADTPARPGSKRGQSEWLRIRHRYETSDVSLRELAKLEGLSESIVMRHSMNEKWRKPSGLVAQVAGDLQAAAVQQAERMVAEQLQPFIDQHKVAITKRVVIMATKGLKRLDRLWNDQKPSSTRSEADGARALETFMRSARTSLGMDGDNGNAGKGLSVEVLGGNGSQMRIRQG